MASPSARAPYWSINFLILLAVALLVPPALLVLLAGAGLTEALILPIPLLLPLLAARWVFIDAEAKGRSGWTWAVLTVAFTLITLVVYLLVRSRGSTPPSMDA